VIRRAQTQSRPSPDGWRANGLRPAQLHRSGDGTVIAHDVKLFRQYDRSVAVVSCPDAVDHALMNLRMRPHDIDCAIASSAFTSRSGSGRFFNKLTMCRKSLRSDNLYGGRL